MKRIRLFIVSLLLIPALLLGWLTLTQSGLNWVYHRVEFYLPMELSLNKLQGKLIGPITVSGLEYKQNGTAIKAGQVIVDWRPADLLIANININQLHIKSLNIVLAETEQAEQPQGKAAAITLPEIHLPWRVILEDGQVDGLSISQNQQSYNFTQVKLDATTLFSQISIKQLAVKAANYSVRIKGDLRPTRDYKHDLEIDWQATLPSSAVIKGRGRARGDLKSTMLKQQLSGPLQLTLDGEISDLLDEFNWQAKVDAARFDLTQLESSWPALSGALAVQANGNLSTAKLAGKLQGNYPEVGKLNADFKLQRLDNNVIQIEQLTMLAPLTETRIETSGTWSPAANGGDVELALNWQNLRWPIQAQAAANVTGQATAQAQQQPWFHSASGNATISGNIDRYRIKMTSDSPWPEILASTWHADATGNLNGLDIQSLRITALDGEATSSGKLSWSPELNWKAEMRASNIDPASLLPQWPGKLNGKLSSSGRLQNGQLLVDADISQISGQLRGYPVSLRSRLNWQNDTLNITQLVFHSGKSQVKLDGQVADNLKLNWSVDSEDLAELYPLAKGQLQAQGKLNGPQATPLIEASFNGKNLRYDIYESGSIEGSMALDLFHWQQIDIRLAAQSMKMNDYQLQSLNIDADSRHITARAVSKMASAEIELDGQVQASGWSGHIQRADFESDLFDNWHLKAPVAVTIAEDTLLADTLCWQSLSEASVCASLEHNNAIWRSHLSLKEFPLILLSQWMPPDLKLEGQANASADIEFQAPEQLLAKLDIQLPTGVISYPMLGGEQDHLEYRSGYVRLTLDERGLNAASELSMTNGDQFIAQLSLPEAKPLAAARPEQPLKASAQLQVRDLRVIEGFVTEVYDLKGEIKLDVRASGTLARPKLSGQASIVDGALQIPGLGLNIDKIKFSGQSAAFYKLSFRLDAHSGDGNLTINGNTLLDAAAGWPTEIFIKGNDFEVARIPDARVQVSPDLQIKLQHRDIDISGTVHVPYARLQPKDITTAAKISNDTVIIGGEQAEEEKWNIRTSVRLTLGERVHFYGFGFEGRLGGNLLLEDEPGQLTKATGEITIPEGTYRAYGQRLEVENGRILYTGSPLTNPGLDVRAVRKVDNVTAGIHVKGSLNQPQLEIFSQPAMSQTDALAYLILGGPIENASSEDGAVMAKAALALGLSGGDRIARSLGDRFGLDEMRVESSDTGDQASLVVGRYLSPKLYASYGVGLIESINTLTLRYRISNKWQIKAESGEAQGADILYTIER